MQFNNQIQLVKQISKKTFLEGIFDCVFVICKSPQLFALISCYFAKKTIQKPYKNGTCFYTPINGEKYRKIKILNQESNAGAGGYWFEEKNGKGDVCKSWKPETWFDTQAILAYEQDKKKWIEGNNVTLHNLRRHPTVLYPTIMSSKAGFENCLNTVVANDTKLSGLLDVESFTISKDKIKFQANNRVETEDKNLIWINAIPHSLKGKKQLVFLSHNYNQFEEFKADIDDLYLDNDQPKIWGQSNLPIEISQLVKTTNVNTPISVWSMK